MPPQYGNKRAGLKMPTNPCNNFIVQFLIRAKITSVQQGLDHEFAYSTAIESVKKYPPPITTYDQLKFMQGFGKFLSSQVFLIIQNYYKRDRLPTVQEKEEEVKQHVQHLQQYFKKSQQKYQDDSFDFGLQSNREKGSRDNQNSYSQKSQKLQLGNQAYNVIKALIFLKADEKPATKEEINKVLMAWRMERVEFWAITKDQLVQAGFIVHRVEDSSVSLTKKTKKCFQSQYNSLRPVKSPETIKIFRKQKLTICQNANNLTLLINKKIHDLGSILDAFQSNSNGNEDLQYNVCEFQVGSFLWMIEGKIIDLIVLRVNAQNFKIEDYKKSCLFLTDTQCKDIIIIFEWKRRDKASEMIDEVICNSRVLGFKVFKSCSQGETIEIVRKIHAMKINDLRNVGRREILLQGSIQNFNERNKKKNEISLQNVTVNIFKCIPSMRRRNINSLINKLPCLKIFHDKIRQLYPSERLQFVEWLQKDCEKQHKGVNQLILDLILLDLY